MRDCRRKRHQYKMRDWKNMIFSDHMRIIPDRVLSNF